MLASPSQGQGCAVVLMCSQLGLDGELAISVSKKTPLSSFLTLRNFAPVHQAILDRQHTLPPSSHYEG
jgi:hypothetical protein